MFSNLTASAIKIQWSIGKSSVTGIIDTGDEKLKIEYNLPIVLKGGIIVSNPEQLIKFLERSLFQ